MTAVQPSQYLSKTRPLPGAAFPIASNPSQIQVSIHIPFLGVLVFPPPDTPNAPVPSITGEVEVIVPPGYGSRKCLGIRLILLGLSRLHHGENNNNNNNNKNNHNNESESDVVSVSEADIFSQQSLIIRGPRILKEDAQRYLFTMELPRDTAQLDAATGNKIFHCLFAIVDGVQHVDPVIERLTGKSSRNGFPLEDVDFRPVVFPPKYEDQVKAKVGDRDGEEEKGEKAGEEGKEETGERMLEETLYGSRIVGIIYNPSNEGVSELNDRFQTFVPELGLVLGRLDSDVVSALSPSLCPSLRLLHAPPSSLLLLPSLLL
jgi:hypothetical protein